MTDPREQVVEAARVLPGLLSTAASPHDWDAIDEAVETLRAALSAHDAAQAQAVEGAEEMQSLLDDCHTLLREAHDNGCLPSIVWEPGFVPMKRRAADLMGRIATLPTPPPAAQAYDGGGVEDARQDLDSIFNDLWAHVQRDAGLLPAAQTQPPAGVGEAVALELLEGVACVEPSFEDERVGYVEVQIDRDLWERARAAWQARAAKGGTR